MKLWPSPSKSSDINGNRDWLTAIVDLLATTGFTVAAILTTSAGMGLVALLWAALTAAQTRLAIRSTAPR